MANEPGEALDRLWAEYGGIFQDFDDLSLARWMSQTLAQLKGRVWRYSHPLVGTYRLAAQTGHQRQIWLKRLVAVPAGYLEAPCCRAPMLPLLTRDVMQSGLVCLHCSETMVPWDELSQDLQALIRPWAEEYGGIHAVAHWDEDQQRGVVDYEQAFEDAAKSAERCLVQLGRELAPVLLEQSTAVIWEDQDECLEVQPEDLTW